MGRVIKLMDLDGRVVLWNERKSAFVVRFYDYNSDHDAFIDEVVRLPNDSTQGRVLEEALDQLRARVSALASWLEVNG